MGEISSLFVRLCWKNYVLRFMQNRNMSSTFRAEKAMEELRKNPYYEKYSKKISAFQNTSPEEFKTRLEEHHKQESVEKRISGENRKFSSLSYPKEEIVKCPSPAFTRQKELNDVMKVELIADKQCSEIKQIWEEYHKQKEVIAAAIPSDVYDVIYSRSLKFPIRMEENRIPKKVLSMNLETTRLRGRPRNRWQDEVRKDGRLAGGNGWRERVHNREEWKKLLRTARNRHILHMPMNECDGILQLKSTTRPRVIAAVQLQNDCPGSYKFLFPLPRDTGYEFIVCQFSGHEAHFTSLNNYQAHKENSPECLTVTHYIDLKEKGLVLMRGEYDRDVLNGTEAQCLANQLQLYYGQDNEKRLNLLERFTYTPQEFKHMDLIAELECLSL